MFRCAIALTCNQDRGYCFFWLSCGASSEILTLSSLGAYEATHEPPNLKNWHRKNPIISLKLPQSSALFYWKSA